MTTFTKSGTSTGCRRGSAEPAWPREPAELVDLSMRETQILCLTYYPVTYFEVLGRPWRNARRLTVPGVAQAKNGLVDLGCGTAQQWFDLCAMVGRPEWIEEESLLSIIPATRCSHRWQPGVGNPECRCQFPDIVTELASIHADEIYAMGRK